MSRHYSESTHRSPSWTSKMSNVKYGTEFDHVTACLRSRNHKSRSGATSVISDIRQGRIFKKLKTLKLRRFGVFSFLEQNWKPLASIVSGSRASSVSPQISDACFVHVLLQYSAHAIIKSIQIWRIWMPQ